MLTFLIGEVSRADCRKYFLAAGYHDGPHKVKALQVFRPSEQDLFPQDSACDPSEIQPMLK